MPEGAELLAFYRSLGAEDHWLTGSSHVWEHVRELLWKVPNRSILDAGCFRGDFLDWLGPGWNRYGIEPATSAAARAAARGIRILGSSTEEPDLRLPELGAVVLLDVIEHLPRPMYTLDRLAKALAPGGRLVILTGDTAALSWRISGLRYWYSALPEHVTFYSAAWFRWAAPRLNCRVGSVRCLAHNPVGLGARFTEAAQNLCHLTLQRLVAGRLGRALVARVPKLRRLQRHDQVWWTSAKDHVLVELVKTPGR